MGVLLFGGLITVVRAVKAIDQTKPFWYEGGYGEAKSWGVWQEGQYYRTETASNWYLLGVQGKGWEHTGGGNYVLQTQKYAECWWCTTTRGTYQDLLISEWEGKSNGMHYAKRYPSASMVYVYTSQDADWDTATCFANVNHSSCN